MLLVRSKLTDTLTHILKDWFPRIRAMYDCPNDSEVILKDVEKINWGPFY